MFEVTLSPGEARLATPSEQDAKLFSEASDNRNEPLPAGPRRDQNVKLNDPKDFEELSRISRRTDLHVDASAGASDSDLAKIAGMKNILDLDLSGTNVTDKGMADVATLSGLRTLKLGWTDVTERGTAQLAKLPHLFELNLEDNDITPRLISSLKDAPELESLMIGGRKILLSPEVFAALAELPHLKGISLKDVNLEQSLEALKTLKNCPGLTAVYLSYSKTALIDSSTLSKLSASLGNVRVFGFYSDDHFTMYKNGKLFSTECGRVAP